MTYLNWHGLAGAPAGGQGLQFGGTGLIMGSAGETFTVATSDLLTMLIFVLDTEATDRANGDRYSRARDALGGASGASYSGHTAAVTAGRGVVLTNTGSGYTFDCGSSHAFAVAIASLCQQAIPNAASQLARS